MSEPFLPTADFLGFRLSALDEAGLLAAVDEALEARRSLRLAALNAAKVVAGARDVGLRELLNRFDLLHADGMSVVWGARLLGLPPIPRITGIDLMQTLLGRAETRGWSVYFLGATEAVLGTMRNRLRRSYPSLRIAGACHGYHPPARDEQVAAAVAKTGADLLFVGMPSPRKERFLLAQAGRLRAPVAMGVGGSFDVLAGKVRRAPLFLQHSGLEWAFRFGQEPGRLWRRYLYTNSLFLYLLMRARVKRPNAWRPAHDAGNE